jgi:ABC-type nitrate/sulfonate/bicarbonate transport system substrate-binding protein
MTAAVMSQRPIAIVARMAKATPTTLVSVDSGIRTLQDLKGKKLGVTVGSGSEVYLFNVLAKAGLKPSDTTYLNLRPEDMPGALANGSVDAINTWQPNIANAEKLLGGKAKVLDTTGIYNETWDLVMMQDYLKGHGTEVKSMLAALLDADAYIHDNRAETIDILSKVVGIDRSAIESSWSNFEFHVALDPALVSILDAHSKWRIATGNLPQGVNSVPDYRKVIFAEPLTNVDAKRVSGF